MVNTVYSVVCILAILLLLNDCCYKVCIICLYCCCMYIFICVYVSFVMFARVHRFKR